MTTAETTATAPPASAEYKPTGIERRMYQALDTLGIDYQRQVPIGMYTLDAYLPAHHTTLEADGCEWHGCKQCGWDTDWDRERRARDKARDQRLRLYHGVHTTRLAGHDLDDDRQALTSVRAALIRAGIVPDERNAADRATA